MVTFKEDYHGPIPCGFCDGSSDMQIRKIIHHRDTRTETSSYLCSPCLEHLASIARKKYHHLNFTTTHRKPDMTSAHSKQSG